MHFSVVRFILEVVKEYDISGIVHQEVRREDRDIY
jgi:hypothetical protein